MIHFLKKYLRHKSIPIVWSMIILILLSLPGSMLPDESVFKIANLDKFVHLGLFGGFVFLWSIYFSTKDTSRRRLFSFFSWIFLASCAYGTTMEFVQKYFIPSRDFELGDIMADVIGSAIAFSFSIIMLLPRKSK
jgi:hypothetical protein